METKTDLEMAPLVVTPEEIKAAAALYETLMPGEVTAIYRAMLESPELGLKAALALQQAAAAAQRGKLPKERVLDAALVPEFVIGVLVGRGQRVAPSPAPAPVETPSLKVQMETLKGYEGFEVHVEYVDYGLRHRIVETLKKVDPFVCIHLSDSPTAPCGQSIPFIGGGCAIRKVTAMEPDWGLVIYNNPAIPVNYDIRKDADVAKLREVCFGPDADPKG